MVGWESARHSVSNRAVAHYSCALGVHQKNEGKDLRLSAKQFAICSIPFICDWYLAIQESDGCFQKMHQYQYYLIPQPYLPQT